VTWTDPALGALAVGFLAVAWLTRSRLGAAAIAGTTVVFLALVSPLSLAILAGLGAAAYVAARAGEGRRWRVAVVAALAASVVVGFKWQHRLGQSILETSVLPLGLSFYSLRVVHYAVEAYKGTLPGHTPGAFARYLLFAPTFVAGPINRFAAFQRDERRRRWSSPLFAAGLERVLYGFVKIVVIGNQLIGFRLGHWLETTSALPAWLSAYLECLRYGLNLYVQFGGYSDVAIGLALAAGFRIGENFRWPFLARNLVDFWQRWHITLAAWCRDYVFGPVAAATRNAFLGVIASMLVLGLWHELSARYAVWGICHGAGIAICQAWRRVGFPPPRSPASRAVAWLGAWFVTQNFVILSFALTSTPRLGDAWVILVKILTFAGR